MLIFEKFQNWQFPELRKSLKFQKNRHTNKNFTNFKKTPEIQKNPKYCFALKLATIAKNFINFFDHKKLHFPNYRISLKLKKSSELQAFPNFSDCNHYPNCRKFCKFQKISKIVQNCLVAIHC